jgi:hypothetical protein
MPNIYSVVAWKAPVGRGVTETWLVELEGYAKRNSPTQPYLVANEYVASRIGQLLGLPVPPGAPIEGRKAGEPGWVTLSFSGSEELLPPANASQVVREVPRLAAGVLVFDLLIANTDRHPGNLSFLPPKRRLDVFDHSHALFGIRPGQIQEHFRVLQDDFAIHGIAAPGEPFANRHCLLDALSDPRAILTWADEARHRISKRFLNEICQEVGSLGVGVKREDAIALYGFLTHRRDSLHTLIRDNRQQFKAIPDEASWGLN